MICGEFAYVVISVGAAAIQMFVIFLFMTLQSISSRTPISSHTLISHHTYYKYYCIDHTYAGTSTDYSTDPPKTTPRPSRPTSRRSGSILRIFRFFVTYPSFKCKCGIFPAFSRRAILSCLSSPTKRNRGVGTERRGELRLSAQCRNEERPRL